MQDILQHLNMQYCGCLPDKMLCVKALAKKEKHDQIIVGKLACPHYLQCCQTRVNGRPLSNYFQMLDFSRCLPEKDYEEYLRYLIYPDYTE